MWGNVGICGEMFKNKPNLRDECLKHLRLSSNLERLKQNEATLHKELSSKQLIPAVHGKTPHSLVQNWPFTLSCLAFVQNLKNRAVGSNYVEGSFIMTLFVLSLVVLVDQ